MKRIFLLLLLFCLSVFLPVGCATSNLISPTSPAENVLSIFNWSDYIDPEVLAEFEQKYNVKIKYDTFDSNESLFAKIRAGNPGYDLIVPTGDYVEIMAKLGLLEELDRQNIPNLKNLDDKFLNYNFDPGNKYSVAYQWGTAGIGYNIKATGSEIDSWTALFDPKYQDRVALIEDLRSVLGIVLIYLGEDPNTTDPATIEKAKNYLVQNKNAISVFAPDTGQTLLDQGEVDLAFEWSGDIFQVMEENPDLRYVIPKEGSLVWVDTFAIPKNAPHKALAEAFINFTLEPEISARISNYVRYATPNKVALEQGLIAEEDRNNPAIYPPSEVFERLQYIHDIGKATTLYDDAWTELKVSMW
jgi:spermidine/putrescine transport system substrate-binding protein